MRNLKFTAASYDVMVEPNQPIELKNSFRGFDVIAHYDRIVIVGPNHSPITIFSINNTASVFYEDKEVRMNKGDITIHNIIDNE
jgi:hypothetical protein